LQQLSVLVTEQTVVADRLSSTYRYRWEASGTY